MAGDVVARIQSRVFARKHAEELCSLVRDELTLLEESFGIDKAFWESSFWEPFRKLMPAPVLKHAAAVRPFTAEEAKRFGATLVPMGKEKGRRVDDVDLDLLLWYAEQRFVDDLRRYLISPRVQAEQT